MKRVSNLAFNREFPTLSGLKGLPRNCPVTIRRDCDNQYDPDAVGIFMNDHQHALGWLFKKDDNRAPVLEKLDQGGAIEGHVEQAPAGSKVKFVVVFWL